MSAVDENTDDQALVAAINGGDSQAFTVLYHRYKDWVHGLAYRMTGHHDDALDVVQETFAYVARKFPGLELTAKMTTFLYPAVRNLSVAARKKRQRHTSSADEMNLLVETENQTPDHEEFSSALRDLSDAHREILLMRFVDDMTQPEIAEALDIKLGTVKSRLHHAVNSVKNSPAVKRLMGEST